MSHPDPAKDILESLDVTEQAIQDTKAEVTGYLLAILCTIAGYDDHTIPESFVYMFVDCNMNKHRILMKIMLEAEWITLAHDAITLTEKGLLLAKEFREVVAPLLEETESE